MNKVTDQEWKARFQPIQISTSKQRHQLQIVRRQTSSETTWFTTLATRRIRFPQCTQSVNRCKNTMNKWNNWRSCKRSLAVKVTWILIRTVASQNPSMPTKYAWKIRQTLTTSASTNRATPRCLYKRAMTSTHSTENTREIISKWTQRSETTAVQLRHWRITRTRGLTQVISIRRRDYIRMTWTSWTPYTWMPRRTWAVVALQSAVLTLPKARTQLWST